MIRGLIKFSSCYYSGLPGATECFSSGLLLFPGPTAAVVTDLKRLMGMCSLLPPVTVCGRESATLSGVAARRRPGANLDAVSQTPVPLAAPSLRLLASWGSNFNDGTTQRRATSG